MVREIVIIIYLFLFQVLFSLFKLFPQQGKTTFVASFADNILFTIEELEKQTSDKIVVLKTAQCKNRLKTPTRTILAFQTGNFLHLIRSIYHLATSHKVIVDNYYGFLSVTNFRPNTECVQLWHAAGAIKQFGLKDLSIANRSERAIERFKKVYARFDHVVVGSENMANVFKESFGLSGENILRTGVPRTDYFYNHVERSKVEHYFKQGLPSIKDKKIILYAPTYRDDELSRIQLKLDLKKMYDKLKFGYVLFLRLHPAVNGSFQNKYPGFVFNMSSYSNINHLLTNADILVTDYSSIPFEFSLLNKPMVFFAYDLEKYAEERGFWEDYEKLVPGPIVETTDDLIDVIKGGKFDLERIRDFANEWNEYSNGTSSEDLIKALYFGEQIKRADR